MKRAALGALLISLVAGSTAMAGTVLPPALHGDGSQNDRGREQHRPDHRNDNNRGSHDKIIATTAATTGIGATITAAMQSLGWPA